jgi:hypothetical protein
VGAGGSTGDVEGEAEARAAVAVAGVRRELQAACAVGVPCRTGNGPDYRHRAGQGTGPDYASSSTRV